MEKLKGKLEPEPETSHSQQVDDFNQETSKVETLLDSVSMAQGFKEEGNKSFMKRDYEAAMFKYEEAIKLLPKDHVEVSHIRANMASCYMQLDPCEYENAIHECDLALSITPDHSKSLLKRARCYEALNKLDLALKDVCMVSKLDPKNPMASEITEKLKKTLESKGLRVNDSVIELPPDYVEPIALWAEEGRARAKKKKNRIQVQEKSDGEYADTEKEEEKEKKKKNNLAAEKGKEKIVDKQYNRKAKGKQPDKRSDKREEQEKIIIREKLLDISTGDVKLVYSDDIRVAKMPLNCTLFQLREVVHERFPSLRAVRIKYKDQEGDLVTITTDEELRMSELSSRSLDNSMSMRFYIVEVSPEQDPFFGRLVEMKKIKITNDSFKTKGDRKDTCEVEDWTVEFARLFKIQAKVDSDTCLNLQELGMKLNSEAMEEMVTSDEAQGPFDKAAQQFQEVVARSLLKLGNVHMSGAKKRLSLLRGISEEFVSEQVKPAYEYAQKENAEAKEKYEEAMKIKPDLLGAFVALGLQQFEEARLSWYYVLVTHRDLKTWPFETVVQSFQNAESSIEESMKGLKNLELNVPGSSTQHNLKDEAARLKSCLDLLLCVVLYEQSIMEYKLDLPTWHGNLEAAMEIYELAETCKEDVAMVISDDYAVDNTLRDLRYHMEEILLIFSEICEAKQWIHEVSSDQIEEILKRRIEHTFHVSNTRVQGG